ncbi:MAG TPA: hypothetical protein VK483_01860 [Chitinophagaceae bacterium]|nr:hypothetical protein [Chitinophagaceae bacterium]
MNKKYWAALITSILGIGFISLYVAFAVPKGGQYGGIFEAAGTFFVEVVLLLFTGLILLMDDKSKPVGKGVLLGTLITAVIGFGICSSA